MNNIDADNNGINNGNVIDVADVDMIEENIDCIDNIDDHNNIPIVSIIILFFDYLLIFLHSQQQHNNQNDFNSFFKKIKNYYEFIHSKLNVVQKKICKAKRGLNHK